MQQNRVVATAPDSPSTEAAVVDWRVFASLAGALLAVVAGIFWHTAKTIGQTWYYSRTFSHGFLIVPIFLYLLWIRRGRLAKLQPKPNFLGLLIITLLAGVWLMGSLGDVRVVQQFALVLMLDAIIWTVLGTAVVRALWFPLAFLLFAVPFGEAAIGPLQDFTAHFAVAALGLSHVPAVLEHRTIWVPSGPWVVAEACSGIRYLVSSLVLGLVYASMVYRSRSRRAIFVLLSVAVPIIANGVRAYGIIVLAYLTNNRLATGVDHIIYGWIFFSAIQLLLFSFGLKWRQAVFEPPLSFGSERPSYWPALSSAKGVVLACLAVLCVAGVAAWTEQYLWQQAAHQSLVLATPVVNSSWRPVAFPDRGWLPALHPVSEFTSSYVSGTERADVYLARFSGNEGVQLVSGSNQFSYSDLWSEVEGGFRPAVINGQVATVRWDVVQSSVGAGTRLIWSWYWIGGKTTAAPTSIKLLQAQARLLAQPANTAVLAISSSEEQDPSAAASTLQDFLRHTSISPAPATPPASVSKSY